MCKNYKLKTTNIAELLKIQVDEEICHINGSEDSVLLIPQKLFCRFLSPN